MFDRWNLIIQGAHVRLITSPVYGFDSDRPLRVGSTGYVSRVERVRGLTEIEVAWDEGDDDYSLFVLRDDDQWNPLSTLGPIDWCSCRGDDACAT